MTRKITLILLLLSAMAWAQSEAPQQDQQQPAPQQRSDRGYGRRGNFQRTGGTITAINGDTLTLKTMEGDTATVKLTSSTQYRRDGQSAKLTDFKVGDVVFVRGEKSSDNTWTAQCVMFNRNAMTMREQLGKKFIAGEVTKIEDTKLTIKRIDGQEQTIEVDENTSFRNAKRESITLADVKVGDHIGGRGDLKDGVFVPAVLRVGAPGEMMMMRRGREGQTPRSGEANPQPDSNPNPPQQQ